MDQLKDDRALLDNVAAAGKTPYSEPKLIYYGGLAELVQHGHSMGQDNTGDDNAHTGS